MALKVPLLSSGKLPEITSEIVWTTWTFSFLVAADLPLHSRQQEHRQHRRHRQHEHRQVDMWHNVDDDDDDGPEGRGKGDREGQGWKREKGERAGNKTERGKCNDRPID